MPGGGRGLVIVLAAGGLLVSGCGETGSGGPSVEPDYPVADDQEKLIPVFRKLREIDPCALHDLEAAKRISPDLDSLVPGDSLGRCTLQGGKGDLAQSWSFMIDAGVLVPQAAPETIGETQFHKQEHNGTCLYVTPIGEGHGLSLQVQWGGEANRAQPPKPACDVAKEYLTAAAARWKTPPKRSENRTQPALPLGLVDPCIAAKELLGSSGATARLRSPHSCGIRTGGADKNDIGLDVHFQFATDPVEQLKHGGKRYRPAEVKGKPAAITENVEQCWVIVQYSPDALVKVDESKDYDPARNQVITVAAKTCDAAKTAADTVVGKLKPPAVSQPAAGAVKLGDLNPPPS